MHKNYNKIRKLYNDCLNGSLFEKNLNNINYIESKIDFLLFQKHDYKKKILYEELKSNGFLDIIQSWPKNEFDKLLKAGKNISKIYRSDKEKLKKYFCIVKKFFNRHKIEFIQIKRKQTDLEKLVNEDLNLFLLKTSEPISCLLINILDILKNLRDKTFEHERDYIIKSQKMIECNMNSIVDFLKTKIR
ncbi:hypothetical protein NAPIS_ORF01967 [Vairimorpha apis BRL 01]|uniref:Uncharacterized protein n=1 Tax=Vairimorpha apis BRL 01 TaxID=1037528 RepID=T0L7M5_9MICR|nr:hypothetical protein NAPIS_ORF01967 [Vairimorpha apis BRL 01]